MAAWGLAELIMLFLMWTVMMVAMMLPSAVPVSLLAWARISGAANGRGSGR